MDAKGYVLDRELKSAVQRIVAQHISSFQPRPQRGRRPRRGKGGEGGPGLGQAWIVNNVECPAGTGPAAQRVPGTFTNYSILEGDIPNGQTIKNYSTLAIPANTVLGVKEIVAGSWSIWPAVC
jgi:hypothetical protein